jgi:hypothetical protein
MVKHAAFRRPTLIAVPVLYKTLLILGRKAPGAMAPLLRNMRSDGKLSFLRELSR